MFPGATIKNLFGGFSKKGSAGDGSWPGDPASDARGAGTRGYVPLTPCPSRPPRLPGTESLKKSISTPSLHSLLGLVTDTSRSVTKNFTFYYHHPIFLGHHFFHLSPSLNSWGLRCPPSHLCRHWLPRWKHKENTLEMLDISTLEMLDISTVLEILVTNCLVKA